MSCSLRRHRTSSMRKNGLPLTIAHHRPMRLITVIQAQVLATLLIILLGVLGPSFGVEPIMRGQDAPSQTSRISQDPNDWPMYNRDVIGTRHNSAEQALSRDNVSQLVEKWRFPLEDSKQQIGVVHATVVVNGYVYFGTETMATVYKLTPDGRV